MRDRRGHAVLGAGVDALCVRLIAPTRRWGTIRWLAGRRGRWNFSAQISFVEAVVAHLTSMYADFITLDVPGVSVESGMVTPGRCGKRGNQSSKRSRDRIHGAGLIWVHQVSFPLRTGPVTIRPSVVSVTVTAACPT